MNNIGNLTKINGIVTEEWFIPTMIKSIELDNSFVLWSDPQSEYYIDPTNNLLKIKYFGRVRVSWPLNIVIDNNEIKLVETNRGYFYKGEQVPDFRLPVKEDLLLIGDTPYEITNIKKQGNHYVIEVLDQETFIEDFNHNIEFMIKTTVPSYVQNRIRYIKQYRSNNLADIYINGEDIVSVAAVYY